MKKVLFPIVAVLALVFSVSSCKTPATKFLDKVNPFVDATMKYDSYEDMSAGATIKLAKNAIQLFEYLGENRYYVLTSKDKAAAASWFYKASVKQSKYFGEELDKEDLMDLKDDINDDLMDVETLEDLAYMLDEYDLIDIDDLEDIADSIDDLEGITDGLKGKFEDAIDGLEDKEDIAYRIDDLEDIADGLEDKFEDAIDGLGDQLEDAIDGILEGLGL